MKPPFQHKITTAALAMLLSLAAFGGSAQSPSELERSKALLATNPDWVAPLDPFKIADGLYFVGTKGIASYLLVTPKGDILLDSTLEQTEPQVEANIQKLGFRLTDIKYIVSSHAHFDHVAGLARMHRATGAKVVALGEDAAAISSGKDNSAGNGPGWEPVNVDRVIRDGDRVTLGNLTLTAHHTPGHTKGCTTWTTTLHDAGKRYDAVFVCSLTINNGVTLTANARHPNITADYQGSIRLLRGLHADVWFAPHGSQFKLAEKIAKHTSVTVDSFVDSEGYRVYLDAAEADVNKRLNAERQSQ